MKLAPLQHLFVLHNNPFLFEPVFPTFYEEIGEQDNGILLAYLVLPLVLPEHTRSSLKNLNARSSLATFTSPTKNRDRLLGLGLRVAEMKTLTNDCLQHNLDLGQLVSGANLRIGFNQERSVEPGHGCPSEILMAAAKLGRIIRGHTIPYVFMQFGIANL
jgi:hypothetical protein